MGDRLELIENKLGAVLDLIERIKTENGTLNVENAQLREELNRLKKQMVSLKLDRSDRSDAMRSKLKTVLSRVEELELMTG